MLAAHDAFVLVRSGHGWVGLTGWGMFFLFLLAWSIGDIGNKKR